MTTVSVVMPTYNAGSYLQTSVASILRQTYDRIEFVVLDDGSTDVATPMVLDETARDPRVRVIRNDRPTGPVSSSNQVVAESRGDIVVRMDADDVTRRDRVAVQVDLLERCPDVVMVASLWQGIDASGRVVRPADPGSLIRPSPNPPFVHASVAFRRAAYERAGGYRAGSQGWEDMDLFLRMRREGRVLIVADALHRYRFHPASTGRAHAGRTWRARTRALRAALGEPLDASEDEAALAALSYLGQLQLWAGQRPDILSQLWSLRSAVGAPAAARALALGGLGRIAPGALRRGLAGVVVLRGYAAHLRGIRRGAAYEWRFARS